jgi:hypothetical protein
MDGQFIQMSSVALHLHQGTVRETMVTVLYALDSVGNVSTSWPPTAKDSGSSRLPNTGSSNSALSWTISSGLQGA